MKQSEPRQHCSDGCGSVVTERNRFFTGKYMTARDFAAEQEYFLSRHRLHNRLLHGWGVVCGFGVTEHPDCECRDWVVVGPGIAIDCCGRELILRERVAVRLPADHHDGAEHGDAERHGEPDPDDDRYLLCAVYSEEEIERVPVLSDSCTCDPRHEAANRVRETVTLEFHRFADFDPGCWSLGSGGETPCRDDCDSELPAPGGGCLEADCLCGSCVPLALVTVDCDGRARPDTIGQRRLPPPAHYLTHVSKISWPHGGEVDLEDLRDDPVLELHFDRKIASAEGLATGINPETLIVHHAGEGESLEFVPFDPDDPPRLVDDCRAVYPIDPGFLRRQRGGLDGSIIYVTLLGDFVLDCHGLAVDVDHIGGRLPSGDGTEGGTFRSWFRVGRSDYRADYQQEASS